MNENVINKLIEFALDARNKAYAPYSKVKVGAALLTFDKKVYTGCNIENASYGIACCAERVAFFKAISDGTKEFEAIVIIGGKENEPIDSYFSPCGMCRQTMIEFCKQDDFYVILAKAVGDYKIYRLKDLMPLPFNLQS